MPFCPGMFYLCLKPSKKASVILDAHTCILKVCSRFHRNFLSLQFPLWKHIAVVGYLQCSRNMMRHCSQPCSIRCLSSYFVFCFSPVKKCFKCATIVISPLLFYLVLEKLWGFRENLKPAVYLKSLLSRKRFGVWVERGKLFYLFIARILNFVKWSNAIWFSVMVLHICG